MQLRCRISIRLDSFVVNHIALFLWTKNLEAVYVLFLLLMYIFRSTALSPSTFTFNSLVFHSRVFSAPKRTTVLQNLGNSQNVVDVTGLVPERTRS